MTGFQYFARKERVRRPSEEVEVRVMIWASVGGAGAGVGAATGAVEVDASGCNMVHEISLPPARLSPSPQLTWESSALSSVLSSIASPGSIPPNLISSPSSLGAAVPSDMTSEIDE